MTYQLISHSFKEITDKLEDMMLKIDPLLPNMRITYIEREDNIIHLISGFNFIDLPPNESLIKKISLYQLID
jgi:hypothetical protein